MRSPIRLWSRRLTILHFELVNLPFVVWGLLQHMRLSRSTSTD